MLYFPSLAWALGAVMAQQPEPVAPELAGAPEGPMLEELPAEPVIEEAPAEPVLEEAPAEPDFVADPTVVTVPERAAAAPSRFVLANTYGLDFGVQPVPSGEVSLFLGGSLPVHLWHPAHWVALGYQGTISVGHADTPGLFRQSGGLVAHRHHLAVLGMAGPKGRLVYGAGVGVVLSTRTTDVPGIEAEGRLGYAFGRPSRGVEGVVGGQVRISGGLSGSPWPQAGAFIGLMHGPILFSPHAADPHHAPPDGLGLLAPGALLFASGLFMAVTSVITYATTRSSGESPTLLTYTAPYAAIAVGTGVPLLVVGAVRHRKWRAYQMRVSAGLAIDF